MSGIIQPVARDTVVLGNCLFTQPENLISLMITAAASKFSTLRQEVAAAGYQVPVGKTLYIRAAAVFCNSTTSYAGTVAFGYGDTDVGIDGASAPTNAKGFTGVQLPYVQGRVEACMVFAIPATKYVYVATPSAGAAFVNLLGVLR